MRLLASLLAVVLSLVYLATREPAVAQSTSALTPAGEGRRLFLEYNCYGCHGGRAQGGMGPNIVHAEAGDLREVVMEGGDGGMPAYGRMVTAKDLSNLVAYLASIGTPNEPTFNDWWVPVPTK
jgi:cytochrome c551